MMEYENSKRLKKIKKLKLYLTLSSTLFLSSASITLTNLSLEKPVMVSESVRDDIIDADDNFNIIIPNVYNMKDNNVDLNITNKTLKNQKSLYLDGSDCGDLEFLKYCTNIDNIAIKNFQYLTNENINHILNLKNLKKLVIYVSMDYVVKNPQYKIDLEIFKNVEQVVVKSSSIDKNEVDDLLIYNVIKNSDNKMKILKSSFSEERLNNIIKWDSEINKILKQIFIDQNLDESEKIKRIVYYVNDKLEYDPEISQYLSDSTDNDTKIKNKIRDYNEHLLEYTFDDEDDLGICCNFTALVNVLAYKAGIESYYISGIYGTSEFSNRHAWNLVNIDGTYYLIDPTFLEDDIIYNLYRSYEELFKKGYLFTEDIMDCVLNDLSSVSASYYEADSNYMDTIINGDNIVADNEEIYYYNQGDNKRVLKCYNGPTFYLSFISSIIELLISMGLAIKIKKEENLLIEDKKIFLKKRAYSALNNYLSIK